MLAQLQNNRSGQKKSAPLQNALESQCVLIARAGLEPERQYATNHAVSEFVSAQDNAESDLLLIFDLLKTLSGEQIEQLETAIKNLKMPNVSEIRPTLQSQRRKVC